MTPVQQRQVSDGDSGASICAPRRAAVPAPRTKPDSFSKVRAMETRRTVAVAVLTALFVGCAGSGSDSGSTTTPPTSPPSGLTYSTNSAVYTVGTAITANTPSCSGQVTSYSVTPSLPAGLSLNTTTGVITGTPTTASPATTYTVTASNSGGSTTGDLSIAVQAQTTVPPTVPPTDLTYSTNPAVYIVGTSITANTPSGTGGAVASYSVSPPLPVGLALNTTTGVISGTPSAVTAAANFTVTASNSAGNTTASLRITVNPSAPTNLSYSTNPATYTTGITIAANNPTSGGGAVVSYS